MSRMPNMKTVGVSLFLAAAAVAHPASAQQVCEVNGGSQPSGSATTSADLACGGSASGFVDPNYPAFGATAVGVNARAAGGGALAIGQGAQAIGGYTVAIGGTSAAPTQATGTQATAIGGAAIASGFNSVAVGMFATSSDFLAVSVGPGSSSAAYGSIAIGGVATATGTSSISVGLNATASASNSVALGANSVATSEGTVSIGSAGAERRITNVAPGTAETDAVNVGQLQSVAALGSSNEAAIAALQRAVADFSSDTARVDTLFDLRSVDRRDMKSGVAAAMAMVEAPLPSAPGKVGFAVNGARFRGQNAVAASVNYRLRTQTPLAVGGALSYAGHKNNGVRVGVAGEF